MSEREVRFFRVFTGWVEERLSGDEVIIFVQYGEGHEQAGDTIEQAIEVEGWVERNGQLAHVESGTRIKRT